MNRTIAVANVGIGSTPELPTGARGDRSGVEWSEVTGRDKKPVTPHDLAQGGKLV
jgi:hypothetical protein